MKDTSLRVPPGMDGTVIDVRVFTRDGVEKDGRALSIEKMELEAVRKDLDDQQRILEDDIYQRVQNQLIGKVASGGPNGLAAGAKITKAYLDELPREQWFQVRVKSDEANAAARAGRGAAALAEGAVRQTLRGEEDQDHRGRRSRARRAQDGEGLPGREAPRAAGRQDGRPARQQGRDLDDRSGRGHAVHGRRHARRHRAEPARRAFAHERRPGARDALGLGREGLGTEDRRDDPQRQRGEGAARLHREDLQPDRRPEGRRRESERCGHLRAREELEPSACRSRHRCSTARTRRRSSIS